MDDVYRVMVVDDEPIVREAIASLIPWEKHQISIVKTAAHAVEALDYLRKNDVELMLVDVCLPVMDGLELIRQVRQMDRGIEFVVISGYSDFSYAQQAVRLGVRDYILKPVDEASLLAVLKAGRDAWEQKRLMRQLQQGGMSLPMPETTGARHHSPTVTRLLAIVEEEIANEQLSLKWISSEKMYLNENYLSKLFQKELHQRFSAYLLERRMLLAMRLMLHDPDILIQTVARETGFGNSAQYFSIAFKKYTGYTPTDYRRMLTSRQKE
ncbi:MAG: response regulator [Aristaeellaceae bacterium]